MEPISAISGGISIVKEGINAFNYVLGLKNGKVISALFDANGTRKYGNKKVIVEKINTGSDVVWWYKVKEINDYVFVRFPVIDSVVEEIAGQENGESNPGTIYWRWVSKARSGTIVDGSSDPVNITVDFIIVGYQPKALIDHFKNV